MRSADLEQVWAAAGIDAAYAALLRTIVQPTLPTDAQPETPSLSELLGLCCEVLGGAWRQCEQAALAWNVLYTALYLLDGIEDGDLRDGPWSAWGSSATINLSTGLLATTGVLLSRLESSGVRAEIAQRVRADFFETLLGMTAGQHQDLTLAEPTLDQCWAIVRAKSGRLFALACRSGALLAGAELQQAARCAEFGMLLGVLIQVGDDLGDLWSKQHQPGDLRSGDRWTLPVAYAMTVLPPDEQRRFHELLRAAPADPAAEAAARSQVLSAGAILYLATEARLLYDQAADAIRAAMPESSARDRLFRLLDSYTPLKDR